MLIFQMLWEHSVLVPCKQIRSEQAGFKQKSKHLPSLGTGFLPKCDILAWKPPLAWENRPYFINHSVASTQQTGGTLLYFILL